MLLKCPYRVAVSADEIAFGDFSKHGFHGAGSRQDRDAVPLLTRVSVIEVHDVRRERPSTVSAGFRLQNVQHHPGPAVLELGGLSALRPFGFGL
jgi:hypothetical protein